MKRRYQKLAMSLCMAASLSAVVPVNVLGLSSPEFARTAEEWDRLRDNVLEYEEIEDLIFEYNAAVLNNRRIYQRDYAGMSADQFAREEYQSLADQLYQQATYATDDASALSAELAARTQEMNSDKNVESGDTKMLEYELAEKKLVMQAQSSMNTYYQLQNQLTALTKNRELLDALLNSANVRQTANMATASEVLSAKQALQNADAQLIALKNQIETTRQNLIVMMGWKADAVPEIRAIPAVDLNRIAAMNLEADTARAYEHDYALRLNQMKAGNSTLQENADIYNRAAASDRQQIAVAVNTAYQAVMTAKLDYDEAALNLDIASKNMTAAQTKYQLGSISRLEFLQSEAGFVTAQTDKAVADLKLFQVMENYDWTVKGVR